ncbi:MAG: hypothetical protein H6Q59_949 [Firmicutes bacterium]|nr:hypothetical protein [Bacillota bacterium]
MEKYQLKIVEIVDEINGIKSFYFDKPTELTWSEGAHVHLAHLGYDAGELPNKNWLRHMSITTLSSENRIGITTKVPGSNSEFKTKLAEQKVGDELILFKFGSRMFLRHMNQPIILLSMGVGMATMRPVILAYLQDRSNIPYLLNINVNSSGEFLFRKELDPLTGEDYHNEWITSRAGFYEALTNLPEKSAAIYYVVGTDDFMKETIHFLNKKGIVNSDIILDRKDEKLSEYFSYSQNS